MTPPKLTKKQASDIQEKAIADALGWSQVAGSGSRHLYPGDVISDSWLGECKTHVVPGQKIKFDAKVWLKLREEAKSRFKYPALFVDDGSQKLSKTWVMFSDAVDLTGKAYIFDYKYPIKTNIGFIGETLANRIIMRGREGMALVYQAKFCDSLVYICLFDYFRQMFGESE